MSEKVSLKQFVDDNYPLIASMGVAGALTAFFTRLENADLLAFMSFLMFAVLILELAEMFPEIERATLKLNLFKIFSLALFVLAGFYVLEAYWGYLLFLGAVLSILIGWLFLNFLRRLPIYKKLVRTLLLIGLMILVFILSNVLAQWIEESFLLVL